MRAGGRASGAAAVPAAAVPTAWLPFLSVAVLIVPLVVAAHLPLRHARALGTDPFAIQVGLHLGATLLLLALAWRVSIHPLVPVATAVPFAVHPLHVDPIADPAGRPELLATVLSLAALLLVIRTRSRRDPAGAPGPLARRLAAGGAAAAVFGAVAVHPLGLATPALVVALERSLRPPQGDPERAGWKARALVLAAYAGAAAAGAALGALRTWPPGAGDDAGLPPLARALSGLAGDVGRLFYPLPGFFGAPRPAPTVSIGPVLFGAGIATVLAWAALRRRAAGPAGFADAARFGAALLLAPYAVASALGGPDGGRGLHLASAGFALLLGLAFGAAASGAPGSKAWRPRPLLVLAALAALVAGLTALTWARCHERSRGPAPAADHAEAPHRSETDLRVGWHEPRNAV